VFLVCSKRPGRNQSLDTFPFCMLGAMSTPETPPPTPSASKPTQPRNPLHGVTLEAMVVGLADYFGWDELGRQIPIRCFQIDPSVGSSLKFLRKTPWAREKVESLYLFMLRDQRRNAQE